MNATHTPGPWFLDQYGHVYGMTAPAKGDLGEMVSTSIHICTSVTNHADRRLIAAAPELLDVAQSFVELYEAFELVVGSENGSTGRVHCALDAARAAIAKAKGDLSGMWDAIPDDERAELTRAFAAGFAEQLKGGEQ